MLPCIKWELLQNPHYFHPAKRKKGQATMKVTCRVAGNLCPTTLILELLFVTEKEFFSYYKQLAYIHVEEKDENRCHYRSRRKHWFAPT